jgi:hypothetical protein
MIRTLLAVVSFLLLAAVLGAQNPSQQFVTEFNQALGINDDKQIDKAVKRAPNDALLYYELVYWDKDAGKADGAAKVLALKSSWTRLFEGSDTIEQLDRWLAGSSQQVREQLLRIRTNSGKLYRFYYDDVQKGVVKAEYLDTMNKFIELARQAEGIGHMLEVSSLWGFASIVGSKMPEKTIQERRDTVFATEQMLAARKNWKFTFDDHFIRSSEWAKHETGKIADAEKAGDKRKSEGYSADAKGVDALAMPGVPEQKLPLKFEALPGWDELDFGSKGGPVPPFWWMASTTTVGTSGKLAWFRAKDLYLHRTGAAKFAVGFDGAADAKNLVEVDASAKGKVSTVWLDAEKKRPYALAFWVGSDRQFVNEAECNVAPGQSVANVYYRSASSWKAQVGADVITLYDDSCDGNPGGAQPFAGEFRSPLLGDHDADKQSLAPLFDSMRIGKGPRMPFSEFVKLTAGWHHVKKQAGDEIAVRPLNPEYLKTGKVKLAWNGPKPTAPVQLVIQGSGDFATAMFDVAGGKEVEVPAGDYQVIWGRMLIGKAPRVQAASIYGGSSKPFTVEAGKTFELKMGGPFELVWSRRGDDTATIDALKILLKESSGCVFTEWHGVNLACEVLAAKEEDGKGAKVVGKFVRFSDPELVNQAATAHNAIGLLAASFPMPEGYRSGELKLTVKLPSPGMKLSLQIKKHPLFGDVKSAWQ